LYRNSLRQLKSRSTLVFVSGLLLLLVIPQPVAAQEIDSNSPKSEKARGEGPTLIDTNGSDVPADSLKRVNKLENIYLSFEWYMKYFPIPYGSYSQETNWLFGISKFNAFKLNKGNKLDSITQPSSVNFFAYITLNGQHKTGLETNLMLNKNKALWKSYVGYTDYPMEFFGVGNATRLEDQRTLITTDWQISTYYLFKTWKKWYLGPTYDFFDYTRVELEKGAQQLPNESIDSLHNLGNQSGLGLKLLMEGRDNRLNAKAGFYVEASYQLFDSKIGSDYNYNSFMADFRYYYSPSKKLTIATQIRTEARAGDVPIQSLSLLGGDNSMRGTYRGRYRDLVELDSQIELRFPIYWIFGGVLFNGVGQVAPTYSQVRIQSFYYNYGLGLRVKVDSKHDVNLRFDYGISNDQKIFAINFAEAF
jgi:hypothetical protein